MKAIPLLTDIGRTRTDALLTVVDCRFLVVLVLLRNYQKKGGSKNERKIKNYQYV